MPTQEELILGFDKVDNPRLEARRQEVLGFLLKQFKATQLTIGWMEGELTEARVAVRRVLAVRQLPPSEDDDARLDACNHLETLRRWLGQAVTAASVADALA